MVENETRTGKLNHLYENGTTVEWVITSNLLLQTKNGVRHNDTQMFLDSSWPTVHFQNDYKNKGTRLIDEPPGD